MPDTTSLYDSPLYKTFTPDHFGRQELQKVLDNMYRTTRVASPSSPTEIRFNPITRKTQYGFRYTSLALSRVCRALSPGLSNVISNVSGPTTTDKGQREKYSTPVACAVFNQLVDLRFHAVLTKAQLVMDEERKTLEGMLGPQTHYLENSSLLDLVENALTDCCDARFAGATLAGRRLFVRYLRPDVMETPLGDYRCGYAVCATESGDDSIRAYLLYESVETGHSCLEIPAGGTYRQRRTGSKFMEQIKRLLVKLAMAKPRDFNHDLVALDSQPLFPNTDERTMGLVMSRWRRQLKLAGMPADMANNVVNTLVNGTDSSSPPSLLTLAELTEHDLFVAAMAAGQNRGQRLRELSERATFSVFFGDSV